MSKRAKWPIEGDEDVLRRSESGWPIPPAAPKIATLRLEEEAEEDEEEKAELKILEIVFEIMAL